MPASEGAWAWAGYLVWLLAGSLDFLQHRRSDLAHTSGLAESSLHGVQLGLLGLGVLAWLALAPGLGLLLVLGLLVVAHALVGYADTRVAWPRRSIAPLEQHVHSVLDMAPWIALGCIAWGQGVAARGNGWGLQLDPAPLPLWALLLLPAAVCCMLPWALEYRSALAARTSRGS
jgi:hypothetical protein